MIQVAELKLNNQVKINGIGLVLTKELLALILTDEIPQSLIHPIPLTAEVLEKCGFVYRSEHRGEGMIMDLNNKDWKLGASMAMGREYDKNGGGWKYLGAPCCQPLFYVHQLQNIFHALTGSELTLTL